MFEGVDVADGADGRSTATALLTSVLQSAPGLRAVAALATVEPAALGEVDQVRLLRAWERQARWVAARQSAALAAVAGSPTCLEEDELAAAEIGTALRLAPRTAAGRIDVARQLAGPLTDTAAALERGEISMLHAATLAEETEDLADAMAQAVQARMLPRAERSPVGRFRAAVRRAVATADVVGTEVRAAAAVANREVQTWAEADGMGQVSARLPAAGVALVEAALTAGAHALGSDDPRSMAARRADVLIGWARTALEDPGLPTVHRRRPHVQVTVDLPTLLGLAENPGELAGFGPIPASAARALAADGEWRRLVTDRTTGTLLDVGRRTYTPPAALVDFLLARDGTCRFPGCPRSAERCDLDHGVPWEGGGSTDRDNLGALCRRHHRLKTHTGWSLQRHPDGSVTWTSPIGFSYSVPPPTVPPDGRSALRSAARGPAYDHCRPAAPRHGWRCVRRVFAPTMAVNLASRRVMDKPGLSLVRTFHLEGDDPIDGGEHGEVEYERRERGCGPGTRLPASADLGARRVSDPGRYDEAAAVPKFSVLHSGSAPTLSARRMTTRGHLSRPRSASCARMRRNPSVSSDSARARNPSRS